MTRTRRIAEGIGGAMLLVAMLVGVARLDVNARLSPVVMLSPQKDLSAPGGEPSVVIMAEVQPQAMPSVAPVPAAAPAEPGARQAVPAVAPPPDALPVPDTDAATRRARYDANVPKTIFDLQQFRRVSRLQVTGPGGMQGSLSLIDLNPQVGAWFIMSLEWDGRPGGQYWHIENPDPSGQRLALAGGAAPGLAITAGGQTYTCTPWAGSPSEFQKVRAEGRPYGAICERRLYLRNPVAGHYTDIESVTEFLRDNVWGGEDIVGFFKETVYQDAFRESGKAEDAAPGAAPTAVTDTPPPALLAPQWQGKAVVPESLGIAVDDAPQRRFVLGQWYRASGQPGVHVSVMQPQAISDYVIARNAGTVDPLDAVEGSAFTYLIAFDLSRFDLRFAMGTDHPRIDWSSRVPAESRKEGLPGPDGLSTWSPLVTSGMVGPGAGSAMSATFTGGFRRDHGGFKHGELSKANAGSHYGFVENGVVFSKLQPGLATLFVLADGTVRMKTWSTTDDVLLPQVRFARQNGVPLVETSGDGKPVAGPFVNRWGLGNWSGSAEQQLRTLRAGACLIDAGGRQHLVYGYFSTATPSAMAQAFTSYGCSYAMLLDMNALVHTYMALYTRDAGRLQVQHLVEGMSTVDATVNGKLVPRFVAYPDNRDFFYLVRKKEVP